MGFLREILSFKQVSILEHPVQSQNAEVHTIPHLSFASSQLMGIERKYLTAYFHKYTTSFACLTCIVMFKSLVDLNHPFLFPSSVTSAMWSSNCFFVSLIIRIAWRAWCWCDESPCIIYQGDLSRGFDDMIWTEFDDGWERLYMIVLVIELNLARV